MEQSGVKPVLRGNYTARIDDKGRLKIPNAFRSFIQAQHGTEVFVTSLTGECVWLYPMAVWLEVERRLSQVPSTNPSKPVGSASLISANPASVESPRVRMQ